MLFFTGYIGLYKVSLSEGRKTGILSVKSMKHGLEDKYSIFETLFLGRKG